MHDHEAGGGAARATASTGVEADSLSEIPQVEGDLGSAGSSVIRSGSTALLVYPEGDCDWVTVLTLTRHWAVVRLPSGVTSEVPVEDIGIGVDDTITGIADDGTIIAQALS